jgi:predicted Zn-dependent protease with MMP-like domain
MHMSDSVFERLVGEALDALPDQLGSLINNVVVLIEPVGESSDVLGLYDGVPLTEREDYGGMVMPDRIFIYRDPICAMCDSEAAVRREVMVTVVHEIAHHFGIDDDRLTELGWD